MRNKPPCRHYICNDCEDIFAIFRKPKGRPGCPFCMDNASVRVYRTNEPNRRSGTGSKVKYTDEEKAVLERVLKGELRPYQAAILLGRSNMSVIKKLGRMRKEA